MLVDLVSPTLAALENWVRRAGFQHSRVIFSAPLSCEEQRSTQWADINSLKEALDPRMLAEPLKVIQRPGDSTRD